MKPSVLALILAATAAAAFAQTAPKPAAPAATVHHAATTSTATKLPPGVPPVKGIIKPAFSLRYEDIKIGAGADAEPNKMYKVFYTGYLGSNGRADDGHKFDSSWDHPGPPVKDKDGKPVLGDDGKPKLGEPQPMAFPQGMGRLIPGFDQGFYGMKIGGKRRIFIPWQLAYGTRAMPDRPDHPGIPAKSDLIFDVELVEVTDMPQPPTRMPVPHPGVPPSTPPIHLGPGANGQPNASPGATAQPATNPQSTPPPASQPAPPTQPQAQPK